ncbi:TolB family protein [Sphaerisporangium perillae]|uniref:TolB family protein n=1 Tax=Sphaerisporangium perillae TaxID=2935860 RepID=UPI00200E4F4E|nr:hypothetical protein [Sphaerisporangium perillae]
MYAVTSRATPTPVAQPAPTPVPTPSAAIVQASPSPPPPATKKLGAAGLKITLHENPADPLGLNAYFITDIKDKKYQTYVRDPGADTFRLVAENAEFGDPTISPDGKWIAVNPFQKFGASNYDNMVFIERATGQKFSIDTLKQPLRGLSGVWSPDSKRFLLTFYNVEPKEKVRYPAGFVAIDVAARKATVVMTDDQRDGYGNYDWSPDGAYVVGAYEKKDKPRFGLRLRDLNGNVVRTLAWVGLMPGPGLFSPSGRFFYTYCPDIKDGICVWNLASGNRTATVPSPNDESAVHDWWNEHHLVRYDPGKKTRKFVVIDLHGKVQRTLIEIPKSDADVTQFKFGRK